MLSSRLHDISSKFTSLCSSLFRAENSRELSVCKQDMSNYVKEMYIIDGILGVLIKKKYVVKNADIVHHMLCS